MLHSASIVLSRLERREERSVGMEEHSDFRYAVVDIIYVLGVFYCRDPEDDDRLFILILVASFIILSLILIIGVTTCILICFEDTMEDRDYQNYAQLVQVNLSNMTFSSFLHLDLFPGQTFGSSGSAETFCQ